MFEFNSYPNKVPHTLCTFLCAVMLVGCADSQVKSKKPASRTVFQVKEYVALTAVQKSRVARFVKDLRDVNQLFSSEFIPLELRALKKSSVDYSKMSQVVLQSCDVEPQRSSEKQPVTSVSVNGAKCPIDLEVSDSIIGEKKLKTRESDQVNLRERKLRLLHSDGLPDELLKNSISEIQEKSFRVGQFQFVDLPIIAKSAANKLKGESKSLITVVGTVHSDSEGSVRYKRIMRVSSTTAASAGGIEGVERVTEYRVEIEFSDFQISARAKTERGAEGIFEINGEGVSQQEFLNTIDGDFLVVGDEKKRPGAEPSVMKKSEGAEPLVCSLFSRRGWKRSGFQLNICSAEASAKGVEATAKFRGREITAKLKAGELRIESLQGAASEIHQFDITADPKGRFAFKDKSSLTYSCVFSTRKYNRLCRRAKAQSKK